MIARPCAIGLTQSVLFQLKAGNRTKLSMLFNICFRLQLKTGKTLGHGTWMKAVKHFLKALDAAAPSLKYYATSFWWAWNFSGYGGFGWASSDQFSSSQMATFNSISTISIALTCLLLSMAPNRNRLMKTGRFVAFGGFLGSIGTLILVLLSAAVVESFFMFSLAGVLTGFGSGVVVMHVVQYYGTLNPHTALLFTLRSASLCIMIFFVIIGSPLLIGLVVYVLLFSVAMVLSLIGNYTEILEKNSPDQYLNPPVAIWRFLTVTFFCFIMAEYVRTSFAGVNAVLGLYDSTSASAVIIIVTLLIFQLVFTIRKKLVNFDSIYYPYTYIYLGIVVLAIIFGVSNKLVFHISNTMHFILQTQVFAVYALISFSTKSAPLKVFGIGFFVMGLGSVIGNLVASNFYALSQNDLYRVVFGFSMLAVFLLLVYIIFPRRYARELLAYIADEDTVKGDDQPDREKRGAWRQRISAVSSQHDLSPREREVFILLVKGRGTHHISEKLGISFYTTRAHTRNIYSKTGVHTREQLMKLVDEHDFKW